MPHLVHDIPYQNADGSYNAVIEIPAGTNDKWTTDWERGEVYHEEKNGKPRVIQFLAYPFNYGFIPQTYLSKADGGDGDPLDIVVIAPAVPRASVQAVKILGALDLAERGESDVKVISVLVHGMFDGVDSLEALSGAYPGLLEMIHHWFAFYKGPGAFTCQGEINPDDTLKLIKRYHRGWQTTVDGHL